MKNILFIETSKSGIPGGSYFSLLEMIKGLNRDLYKPYVVFYRAHDLIDKFIDAGSMVFCFKKDVICKSHINRKHRHNDLKRFIWRALDIIDLKRPLQTFLNLKKDNDFGLFCSMVSNKNGIHLIHINDGITPGLAIIKVLGKGSLTPIIVHERKIRDYSLVDRYYLNRVDRVICISKSVHNNLKNYFNNFNKASIIYNPIASDLHADPVKKEKLINEFRINSRDIVLVQISNLIYWKGQRTVISAIPMLNEKLKGPKIILLLVGGILPNESNYFDELKRIVIEYNLEDQVKFCGFRQERAEFIELADIIIHLPSKPEPFGRVVLEAMQMGRPVITSCEGGPAEIVEDGITGWLVPPNGITQLCQSIIAVMKDANKRSLVTNKAKIVASERFSCQSFIQRIERIYDEIFSS
jgi:glycosyltransferase involved in cell wall biosynthesis